MAKAKAKISVDDPNWLVPVDEWNKHVTAERERLSDDFHRVASKSLFQPALPVHKDSAPLRFIAAHDIDPIDQRKDTSKFDFVKHCALLEGWWPGCSVMWDAHPTLRFWSRYELRVVVNEAARTMTRLVEVPFGGEMVSAATAYGQPGHREYDRVHLPREAIRAARAMGAFILVAYELQPLSGRHRWSQARLAVALEAGLAVTVPRRAIFNPQEDSATLDVDHVTKAKSSLGDNAGRCESCNRPESEYQQQTAVPVMLGGGIGWGTMWKCPACLIEHNKRKP